MQQLWLIPALPLFGFLLNGIFGRGRSNAFVNVIALGSVLLSFAWAIKTLLSLGAIETAYIERYFTWFQSGDLLLGVDFSVDRLPAVMLLVVTGIGSIIHIYATGYMAHEGGYYRFFAYLNLFMFFMLVLVLSANYVLLFVGWEGVGLCSYLLIGFYFLKKSASDAGKKAFIVNRIGDFGFMLGMFLLFRTFGTLDFQAIFTSSALQGWPVELSGHLGTLTFACLLIFMGACGKSAQLPLYVWLPDAMEGPTPVSALIHAATMVAAGVYMVARSHVLSAHAPLAMIAVAGIGCATALFAATIALVQTDIKKVLAYSTISQLGYMFLACGVAAFSAGIFHLMTHAFFKALLFLAAGSVIHAMGGEQDMRRMGGLRSYIPWTFLTMGIATLAIAGIPPFAGFWSKDEILWQAYQTSWVYWLIGVITAFITSFYMFRLLFMTFFGDYHGAQVDEHGRGSHGHDGHGHGEPHESPMVMLVPLMILAVLSLVGGLVGWHNHFEHFLDPVFSSGAASETAGG